MSAPRSVVIDGVTYVPVAEGNVASLTAADLMTALAEEFWGDGSDDAKDPKEWKTVYVVVTDDPNERDPSIEQFTARLITRLRK